jgi:hypothetical protein
MISFFPFSGADVEDAGDPRQHSGRGALPALSAISLFLPPTAEVFLEGRSPAATARVQVETIS